MNLKVVILQGAIFGVVLLVWSSGGQQAFVSWMTTSFNIPGWLVFLVQIGGYSIAFYISFIVSRILARQMGR